MSRSQEKLDKVATEISKKLEPLNCTLYTSNKTISHSLHTHFTPHTPHTHTTPSTEANYAGREVRVVSVDFSEGAKIFPQIAQSVQDLDIGILGQCTCNCYCILMCGEL